MPREIKSSRLNWLKVFDYWNRKPQNHVRLFNPYTRDENNKDAFQSLLSCENAILEGKVSDKDDQMIDTASQIIDKNEQKIFAKNIDSRGTEGFSWRSELSDMAEGREALRAFNPYARDNTNKDAFEVLENLQGVADTDAPDYSSRVAKISELMLENIIDADKSGRKLLIHPEESQSDKDLTAAESLIKDFVKSAFDSENQKRLALKLKSRSEKLPTAAELTTVFDSEDEKSPAAKRQRSSLNAPTTKHNNFQSRLQQQPKLSQR